GSRNPRPEQYAVHGRWLAAPQAPDQAADADSHQNQCHGYGTRAPQGPWQPGELEPEWHAGHRLGLRAPQGPGQAADTRSFGYAVQRSRHAKPVYSDRVAFSVAESYRRHGCRLGESSGHE